MWLSSAAVGGTVPALNDDVSISSTKAEAIDARTTRFTVGKRRSGSQRCWDAESLIERLDLWVQFSEMEIRRDLALLNSQRRFE